MLYYFIMHTLLGVFAGNAANIYKNSKLNVGAYPLYVHGPYGQLVLAIASLSIIAAPVTTFINWGILWTLATIGELFLGAFLVGLVPMQIRFFMNAISPIVIVVIMGSLWGFWYI